MGRRNITDAQRNLLIGEAYRAQKMSHGGDRKSVGFSSDQSGHLKEAEEPKLKKPKTRDIIAEQFGISSSTVQRADEFLSGVESAETVSPGFREAVHQEFGN